MASHDGEAAGAVEIGRVDAALAGESVLGPGAGDEAVEKEPMHPYTSEDKAGNGIKCHHCKTEFFCKNWIALSTHLRQKHKYSRAEQNGTYMYTMARNEERAQRNSRKHVKKASPTSSAEHVKSEPAGEDVSISHAEKMEAAEGVHVHGDPGTAEPSGCRDVRSWYLAGDDGMPHVEPDMSKWQAMWVRVSQQGAPTRPIEIAPMLFDDQAVWQEPEPSAALHQKPMQTPTQHASSPEAPQRSLGKQSTGSGMGNMSPWAAELPVVSIKEVYKTVEVPPPSSHGERCGGWPVKIHKDWKPNFDVFQKWLHTQKVSDGDFKAYVLGLKRLCHIVQVNGRDVDDASIIYDPAVTVSMFVNELHLELFNLPILKPAYTWTKGVLDSLKLLAKMHRETSGKQQLVSEDIKFAKYCTAVEQLQAWLGGGITKKGAAYKRLRVAERHEGDYKKVKGFPPISTLRTAVGEAMKFLNAIKVQYGHMSVLPQHIQGSATSALVGILSLNGYFGRKLEWELMTEDHVKSQFRDNLDFFVCPKHKTSKIYGSLAKWVAPGTIQAIKVYMDFPLQNTHSKLLAPCGSEVEKVSVPHYLDRFCALFLKDVKVKPTVNLMRKWFHTVLCTQTANEEKLMKFMQRIDAHSPAVAMKHYVLKERCCLDHRQLHVVVHYAWFGCVLGVVWERVESL